MSAFDNDLQQLSSKISEMGGLAEELLAHALEAVQRRDHDLAAEVVARDKALDRMEAELEQRAIRTLALRQPMAADLRETIAALKVASTLERIGDLAKNIARRSQYLTRNQPVRLAAPVVRMGRQTLTQLTEVLDAYTARDTALAVAVWNRDVEIDEIYNSLFRELITYMMEDPRTISTCSQLMFVAKNLERIGDHTTFIAEMAYYMVEGEPLGDDRPKGEPLDAMLDFDV
ncbi:phosphate signaling complex protein PhoU [Rubrimonas cliftonensis]|uniref:Phosphate-specific transport system accessory protein PhoU n=1 Tax=Rubrimonas cliftonensis TaxID=89524 RepID=A0A1H3VHN6_9RHOB|nr:phosphate signaling complex protein PhoU [Rubrimonas cliftonensis]SDZ74285.1 phosphate transport system protein [Rubrimonas cliftonensis]